MKYAVLLNPGHNRVYYNATKKLAIAELTVALQGYGVQCDNVECVDIAGVGYVTFVLSSELDSQLLGVISHLSFVYALYEVVGDMLKPIELLQENYLNDSFSSILKYTGKTNELFTRMMINIAVQSADCIGGVVNLLDPIAGKGTTLYEALIRGYNAYGVEVGEKPVAEAYAYVKKFLTTESIKHDSKIDRISGAGKAFTAKRYAITLAKTKDEYKKNPRQFVMLSGNSRYSDTLFKHNFFDVIVGDLPYGVQHSNVTNENQSSFTRNPYELIRGCSPSWHSVLKSGGVLVLAWNNLLLPRDKFVALLEEVGFEVLNSGVYLEFEHRVDNSINRDIIVAKKKNV